MEVHFAPETERKLKELAATSGGSAARLVEQVVEGYFQELDQTRDLLNGRFDDLKNGRVVAIPSEAVTAHFREKSTAARRA